MVPGCGAIAAAPVVRQTEIGQRVRTARVAVGRFGDCRRHACRCAGQARESRRGAASPRAKRIGTSVPRARSTSFLSGSPARNAFRFSRNSARARGDHPRLAAPREVHGQDRVGGGPQEVIGRQRLGGDRSRKAPPIRRLCMRLDQRVLIDRIAAPDVDPAKAEGFIARSSAAPIMWRLSGVAGAASITQSNSPSRARH